MDAGGGGDHTACRRSIATSASLVMSHPSAEVRGSARSQASLSQTIDVETPELVVFSYTIAGVGSRALAAVIDALIIFAMILSLLFTLAGVASTSGTTAEKARRVRRLGGRRLWGSRFSVCSGATTSSSRALRRANARQTTPPSARRSRWRLLGDVWSLRGAESRSVRRHSALRHATP